MVLKTPAPKHCSRCSLYLARRKKSGIELVEPTGTQPLLLPPLNPSCSLIAEDISDGQRKLQSNTLVLVGVVIVVDPPGMGSLQPLVGTSAVVEPFDVGPPGSDGELRGGTELVLESNAAIPGTVEDFQDLGGEVAIVGVLLIGASPRLPHVGVPLVGELLGTGVALEGVRDREIVAHGVQIVAGLAGEAALPGDGDAVLDGPALGLGGMAAAGEADHGAVAHLGWWLGLEDDQTLIVSKAPGTIF